MVCPAFIFKVYLKFSDTVSKLLTIRRKYLLSIQKESYPIKILFVISATNKKKRGTILPTFPRLSKLTLSEYNTTILHNYYSCIYFLPYAIAAKFAFPDRTPVAITGDGAMQMLAMNELITISKYWKEWADPRLITIVLNNRDLNMVTWEQRMLAGEPKFEASQDIPDVDYAAFARLLGLKGVRINRPDQIGQALDEILNSDRPSVLDVVCDPNVPIIPPHIDLTMLVKFNKAMMKGDPQSSEVIRQSIKQSMQGGSSFF